MESVLYEKISDYNLLGFLLIAPINLYVYCCDLPYCTNLFEGKLKVLLNEFSLLWIYWALISLAELNIWFHSYFKQ